MVMFIPCASLSLRQPSAMHAVPADNGEPRATMLHCVGPCVSKSATSRACGNIRRTRKKSLQSQGLKAWSQCRAEPAGNVIKSRRRANGVAGEDGIVSGMAGRYATALFDLARETNAVDQVQSDLKFFDALIASNPDLQRLVRSPVFGADEQEKALGAVLDKAGIGGIAAKFLRVVTSNRRLFAV